MNRLTQLLRVTPLALALAPAAVWADTNTEIADLKARLQQLEQQVKEAAAKPAPVAAPAASSNVAGIQVGDTQVKFSGYFKLDAVASRYSDGLGPTPSGSGAGRTYFSPAAIPVNAQGAQLRPSNVFDMTARQTRFALATTTPTASGTPVKGYLEMDFYGSTQGTTNITNAYSPELRHAYLNYGNWTAGQTWTTLLNVDAFPETADYVGPSNGTVFARQAQLRYTNGGLSLAMENPQTVVGRQNANIAAAGTLTTSGATGTATDNSALPDLVAKYTHKGDFGQVSVAVIGRQLTNNSVKSPTTNAVGNTTLALTNDRANVAGISLAGKVKVGSSGDDIRFMLTSGRGMGRYLALGLANDASVGADGRLHVVNENAGFIAYRHLWTDKLRSTVQYSAFIAKNPSQVAADATKSSRAYLANLFYSVNPKLDVGVEYLQADRTLEGGTIATGTPTIYAAGQSGDLRRIQGTMKYTF